MNVKAMMPRCHCNRALRPSLYGILGAALLTLSVSLPARADGTMTAPGASSTSSVQSNPAAADAPTSSGATSTNDNAQSKQTVAGKAPTPMWTSLPPYGSWKAKTQDTDSLLSINTANLFNEPDLFAFRRMQPNPVGVVARVIPVYLRLGAELSPRGKFDGGIDVTIPGLSLGPHLSTRVDADAIVSANFGGVTTLVPVTIDQVYTIPVAGITGFYLGGGIGPYIGNVTRFGGKIFAGGLLTRQFALEGSVHFAGFGDPLLTLQLRIGL